jgi:hypothetical protein
MTLFSSCRSIPRTCLSIQTSRFEDVMLAVALSALVIGLLLA